MKNLKINAGLFLVIVSTLFFASSCSKNKEPNERTLTAKSIKKPKGVAFTKWDAQKKRIVFIDSAILRNNIKAYLRETNSYDSSIGTPVQYSDSQITYFTSSSYVGALIPTIAVFNYGGVNANTIVHVRAINTHDLRPPPDPAWNPVPTPIDPVNYPGLRTFTSATVATRDVRKGSDGTVQLVQTPVNQYDFATRLDAGYNRNDYFIDAWTLTSTPSATRFALAVAAPYPVDNPNTDPFTDPATGNPKYKNYFRLLDNNGHETRVEIVLEEP